MEIVKTTCHLPQTITEPISPNLWPSALQITQQLGRAKKNMELTFLDSISRCYWCSMKYIDKNKTTKIKSFLMRKLFEYPQLNESLAPCRVVIKKTKISVLQAFCSHLAQEEMRLKAYSSQTKTLHLCFDILLKPSRVVFISWSKGKQISLVHRRCAPLGTIGRHH